MNCVDVVRLLLVDERISNFFVAERAMSTKGYPSDFANRAIKRRRKQLVRVWEHYICGWMAERRTHPSTGLITTRLVPLMTASPSDRVVGGDEAAAPPSGSARFNQNRERASRIHQFFAIAGASEISRDVLTSDYLLHLVHDQIQQLVISLQYARDCFPIQTQQPK
jgi:hypothetical protein